MKYLDSGDFFKAWGGISSLQLALPAIWTKLKRGNDSLSRLARWMCEAPATIAGFEKLKGSIAAGYDADLVVWNPEKRFVVRPKLLQHRHKLTPYTGSELRGAVISTFLEGEMIYDRGRFLGAPQGKLLRRRER